MNIKNPYSTSPGLDGRRIHALERRLESLRRLAFFGTAGRTEYFWTQIEELNQRKHHE